MVILSVITLNFLGGCSDTPDSGDESATIEDCQRVQDHLATLRIEGVAKNTTHSESELAKHKTNFAASSTASLQDCAARHSKGWAHCMLALSSSSDAKSCDE